MSIRRTDDALRGGLVVRISTNVMALGAWRNLVETTSGLSKTLERLSSGQRINRAADDAAGLTISEMMRAQIRGLNQALRNAQDGISLVQTAEGALGQIHAILQRLRELAVQASTDTLTDANRDEVQKEVRQLIDQINQIANTTHFNTIKLLNGTVSGPEASPAQIEGSEVTAPLVIEGPTAGYAQGQPIPDTGHAGSTPKAQPAYAKGSQDLTSPWAWNFSGLSVTQRTLKIRADGTDYFVTLSENVYASEAELLNEINARLASAGAPVVASISKDNSRLVLTHFFPGSEHAVEVVDLDPADPNDAYSRLLGGHVQVGGVDQGDVWLHSITDGYVTGSVKITDPGLQASPITFSAPDADSFVLRYTTDGVNWTSVTVVLPSKTYDGSGPGRMRHDLLADLQAAIDSAVGGPGIIQADFEPDHTLRLTVVGGGVGSAVEVQRDVRTYWDGSGWVSVVDAAMDRLFGDGATHLHYTGEPANNALSFLLNGEPAMVTLSSGHYDDTDAVVAELNAQFAARDIDATASNAGGAVRITSNRVGSTSSVTNVSGSAAPELNLGAATEVAGSSGNALLALQVDGEEVLAALPEGTYTDPTVLAAALEQAINEATQTASDVSVRYRDSRFVITSGTAGSSSRLVVRPLPENDAAPTLGLQGLSDEGTDAGPMTIQIGANVGEAMSFAIADARAQALGLTTTDASADGFDPEQPLSNDGVTEYVISLKTRSDAERALEAIDEAIRQISSERSHLGAVQNRFEMTVSNLLIAAENLTAAHSRIRDADMAREMMEFVRQQILMQSGTAMLAQANLVPQSVLQLLG